MDVSGPVQRHAIHCRRPTGSAHIETAASGRLSAKGRDVAVIDHPPGAETQFDRVELPGVLAESEE
jgi:hypothetical protein